MSLCTRSVRVIIGLAALAFAATMAGAALPSSAIEPTLGVAALKPVPRILYSSDWSGTGQIYAVDPSRRKGTAQLTFGRAPACAPGSPCGYTSPIVSPNGRRLIFTDYRVQGPRSAHLFVARADGRARRQVATLGRSMYGFPAGAWSPDSQRIAYTDAGGVHVVFADGSKKRRVPTSSAGDYAPAWSPDGSSVAFLHPHSDRTLDLVVVRGRVRRLLARREQDLVFSWSPTGSWIAFSTGKPGLKLVTADGARRRTLPTTGLLSTFAWSRDSRLLAFVDERALRILDLASMRVRVLGPLSAYELAWSPDGRRLAFRYTTGVQLADVRTGRISVLTHDQASTLSWAPDGSAISYLAAGGVVQADRLGNDLRIVDLRGRSRTVVAANDQFGGSIEASLWTRPPSEVRYRKPTGRPLGLVSSNAVAAPWAIDRLVADGNRVAFTACGHLFVWTPFAGSLVQAERSTSLSPACPGPDYATSFHIYDLALAGDRVAYGTVQGGNGRVWLLGGTTFDPEPRPFVLGEGHATNGLAYSGELIGEMQGSGDFLTFSAWQEALATPSTPVTTRQEIRLVPVGGCPCLALASSPGPLVPFDADASRIVAGGDNETWVVDASGTRLLTIPVSPAAAQLSGKDLVLERHGELWHLDASTGALLHSWPLPDATVGRECASPNGSRCPYAQPARLVLQDAARGLVAYVLDDQVHVLRLSDGRDAIVAPGTHARFMNQGLVYSVGSEIRLVPFDQLVLHCCAR